MCGFLITPKTKNMSLRLESLKHRGLPEFKGYTDYKDLSLGHYSLPFVNLDPAIATQPMMFGRSAPSIFVGEIFNHHDFGNYKSDGYMMTDVFRKKGSDIFHKFDGFWSFITFGDDDKLVAYTDYLGQKPIYYRTDMEALCSEIDPLISLGPNTRDELYHSNVMKWGYDPRPTTPWNEIKMVPPGHFYREGKVEPYWDWSKVEVTKNLRDTLFEAVKTRLGGHREISLLLSGGLDSSIIYGIIKKHGLNVNVIHVDNGEEDFSRLVHEFNGGTDRYMEINFAEVSDFDSVRIHQCPVDLGSVKPQIAMAQALRELGVYAVMTGDGADELFGGYNRASEYDSQQSDTFMELPYYHLPKLDRTMMNSTIEVRSPFLSPAVVKHALSLPYSARQGIKLALIDAFGDLVPKEVLERPKKPLKTKSIRKNPMEQRIINQKIWSELHEEQ